MSNPERALYLGVFLGSFSFSVLIWAVLIAWIGVPSLIVTLPLAGLTGGMACMATLRWLGLE